MPERASAKLLEFVGPAWSELASHPFLVDLASGELAPERFRYYVEQNVQYLSEYARAMALAAARSRDDHELAVFARALHQVVEIELPENERLREQIVAFGAADQGGARGPAPATSAYTGWLLSVALHGGADEVLAAILPCTWSYGVIGERLAPTAANHPVYRAWLTFFASEQYHAAVDRMRSDLDTTASLRASDGRRLGALFAGGVRHELGFWDMAYSHWNREMRPSLRSAKERGSADNRR